MIQFPFITRIDVGQLAGCKKPGWRERCSVRIPSVVIDSTVRGHFKILRSVPGRNFGRIETIHHTHPLNGLLFDTIHSIRSLYSGNFKYSGNNINHMMKLGTDSANVFDMTWPGDRHSLACSTEMRSHLLGPFKRSIESP